MLIMLSIVPFAAHNPALASHQYSTMGVDEVPRSVNEEYFSPLLSHSVHQYVFRVSPSWVFDGASWQKDLACLRGVVLKFLL
jgi:hypothetical protein